MALPTTAPELLAVLPETLRRLAVRGELKRYRKGHRLIQEGDQGDTIFILLSGRARVFGSGDDDDREITYGTYGAGEYFGELSLDGGPRSASVVTLEASDCVLITRTTLLAHIAEHPEFAFELLTKVIRHARDTTRSAKQLALNDVYGRLVLLLNGLAHPTGDGRHLVDERLTHQDIANRLGCSREMVSRLVKGLEAGGYLAVAAGRYTLLKGLPARW